MTDQPNIDVAGLSVAATGNLAAALERIEQAVIGYGIQITALTVVIEDRDEFVTANVRGDGETNTFRIGMACTDSDVDW